MAVDNFFNDYDEDSLPTEEKAVRSSGGFLNDFKPWQRFLLSLFLFLDVVVIGLLFLVVLGRMSFG